MPAREPVKDALAERIAVHVEALCLRHPDRHVGSEGNRAANEYFAESVRIHGFEVERTGFPCIDWEPGEVALSAGGEAFEAFPGPYSNPYEGVAELVAASTVEELESLDARGRVLLLTGSVASSQLTPRDYPWYRFEEHTRILEATEHAAPEAVIAATGRDPMAGALYPFPLIEDGDVGIPSAYMRDVDGERLRKHAGGTVRLRIGSRRAPARCEQLVARRPGGAGRVVAAAHIDTKPATPGALDNATGVACLLAVAELLHGMPLPHAVELLPFNGEDHYASPGQVEYVRANEGRFGEIRLAVNIDAAGFRGGPTAVSTYECPDELREGVARAASRRELLTEGRPWPQSDHMIFAMRGVPAVALTSAEAQRVLEEIAHTREDLPGLADPALLAETARFVAELLTMIVP
ncbi:MAG: M28 family peptidase [Coriobacteriia bacterium]|nr:M28 family peptidase [Coriobacteriia bacterium]